METTVRKFEISDVKVLGADEGLVEAYVNTMGIVDHDNDIIDPKAFDASIREKLPIPVLLGHDSKAIIGKVLFARSEELESPEHRLLAVMQMNMNTQAGRDAFSNISGEYVREWSVGFNIPTEDSIEYEKRGKSTIRRIKNLVWKEVSSVISGASPSTMTIAAKGDAPDETEEPEELAPAVANPDVDETEIAASATEEESAADTTEVHLALLRLRDREFQRQIA